jgi:hypothetical protein
MGKILQFAVTGKLPRVGYDTGDNNYNTDNFRTLPLNTSQ